MINGIWDITKPEQIRSYVPTRMSEFMGEGHWTIDHNIFDLFAGEKK